MAYTVYAAIVEAKQGSEKFEHVAYEAVHTRPTHNDNAETITAETIFQPARTTDEYLQAPREENLKELFPKQDQPTVNVIESEGEQIAAQTPQAELLR